MAQIRTGFISRLQGITFGHFAVTQALQLRKDEPDPVAGFASGVEFSQDPVKERVLGVDEALEVEGGWHAGLLNARSGRVWL
ncbi:hypothetical protein D3C75_1022530 [compost metagenome]